jgi:hypothetical protein
VYIAGVNIQPRSASAPRPAREHDGPGLSPRSQRDLAMASLLRCPDSAARGQRSPDPRGS